MEILSIIASVAGILGTIIAIIVVFKSKQIFGPKLTFNIGLCRTISSNSSKEGGKLLNSKKQLNTLVYAGIPKKSKRILAYPNTLIPLRAQAP